MPKDDLTTQLLIYRGKLEKAQRHKDASVADLQIAKLTVNHYQEKVKELEQKVNQKEG